MRRSSWWAWLVVAACTGKSTPPAEVVPEGCNPLAYEWDCLLPYPSDTMLVDDPTLPSGKRVAIPERARFKQDSGYGVDFLRVHKADGFSHMPAILAVFPQLLSPANLRGYDGDYAHSTDADNTTVLLDAATGERVMHMAEVDVRTSTPGKQALIIRPLARLKNRARYIVALRGLKTLAGANVTPPEGFRRVRDGQQDGSARLTEVASHFNAQVFPMLQAAGVERSSLILAWDFTTESLENVTRDMLEARALVVAALEQAPPPVRITEVNNNDSDHVYRRIEALMDVPSVMATEEFGSVLNRDTSGRVALSRTTQVAFTVLIPNSVRTNRSSRPARVLQYGHGFFGSRSEMLGSFFSPYIDAHHMVGVGVDWWGMSSPDVSVVLDDLLNNMDETMRFTDRVHQGMMNQIALEYVVRHVLPGLEELKIDGVAVVDGQENYFYGNSEGHILGGTFMGLSRYIDRGVLGVGGMGFFSLIAMRARPFISYLTLINQTLTDPLETQKLLATGQNSFDRIDPGTYAVMVRQSGLATAPATRHVLMQTGLGDTQVPSLAAECHARSLGLTLQVPGPKDVPGLVTSADTVEDSAYVQFDFHLAQDPLPGTLALFADEETPVHEGVRRSLAGAAQADGFLHPQGTIVHTCNGPCDPE